MRIAIRLLGAYARLCGEFIELEVSKECISVDELLEALSRVCRDEIDLENASLVVGGRPVQSGEESVCVGEKVVVVPMGVGG